MMLMSPSMSSVADEEEVWDVSDQDSFRAAPLTEEEEALQSVRRAEQEAQMGTSGRKSHVSSGVAFPFSEEATEALKNLQTSNGFISLVQLVWKNAGER